MVGVMSAAAGADFRLRIVGDWIISKAEPVALFRFTVDGRLQGYSLKEGKRDRKIVESKWSVEGSVLKFSEVVGHPPAESAEAEVSFRGDEVMLLRVGPDHVTEMKRANQAPQPNAGTAPFADEALPPRG